MDGDPDSIKDVIGGPATVAGHQEAVYAKTHETALSALSKRHTPT